MSDELLDFEEIERNRYENMSFAKRVVLCSFTEIMFQRKLLPDDAFKAVLLKGVKLFVFDAHHDDAYENLVKLSKICEEIENEAVKTLRFLVNLTDGSKERVGEVFEIQFTYGKIISISLKLGNSVDLLQYNRRTEVHDFQKFVMRLRQFCRTLRELPEGSYGRYHVVYFDGKRMQESASEYFKKVVRAPLEWNGPKQEICGIVGTFNRREIGMKMSVGTLFGTGATAPMALAEQLQEENWIDGGWEQQMVNTHLRFKDGSNMRKTSHVPSTRDGVEERQEKIVMKDGIPIDEFEWNDDLDGDSVKTITGSEKSAKIRENSTMDKNEEKMKMARAMKGSNIMNVKKRRVIEKKKEKSDYDEDGLAYMEVSSNDTAKRGSDIDLSLAMNEEGIEKEGRMDMRRKRKRMDERKEESTTTLPEARDLSGHSLGDMVKMIERSPGDSTSTTHSSENEMRSPGVCKKRFMGSK